MTNVYQEQLEAIRNKLSWMKGNFELLDELAGPSYLRFCLLRDLEELINMCSLEQNNAPQTQG